MTRIIRIIMIMTVALCSLTARGADWRIHTTFDEYIHRVIPTGDYVYMSAYAQLYNESYQENSIPRIFLYRYDRKGEELQAMTSQNYLKRNLIQTLEYNHAKKYLLVVYDDYDIDLIYDNGTRKNIPGLKLASMRYSKNVNGITFHPASNRAFLATDFGYVEINDDKGEISTSRNYGIKLMAAGRLGDNLYVGDEFNLYRAPYQSAPLTFTEFKRVPGVEKPTKIFTYNDSKIGVTAGEEYTSELLFVTPQGDSDKIDKAYAGRFTTKEQMADGFMISTPSILIHYVNDGSREEFIRRDEENMLAAGSQDFREFWFAEGRKGLKSMKCSKTDNVTNWQVTSEYMLPNASSVFISTYMYSHPKYGMLVNNHGIDHNFKNSNVSTPILLTGYKDLEWTRYSPAYTKPEYAMIQTNPNGLAIDPDNSDYVYTGSILDGILRLNLSDPDDILLMAQTKDNFAHIPEFAAIAPVINFWDVMCAFQAPEFDADGNLWATYNNLDKDPSAGSPTQEAFEIWVWPKSSRLASKDAKSVKPWSHFTIKDITPATPSRVLPLRSAANKNLLLVIPNTFNGPMLFIDTKGTPANFDDDVIEIVSDFHDQDGNEVSRQYIMSMYEDVATGLVWVGSQLGLFTINPAEVMKGNTNVTRIKVARNDGTDLADYLLNGVIVNAIAEDGNGRKWFGTGGAGIVCTSSDGRNILAEYTEDDSLLPDNTVYGLGYNQHNNSMMISTTKGLAELMLSTAAGASDMDNVRCYPNPVRPTYYGYVTIDGLVDGALVKIVDATGNLVKELGFAGGGSLQWDVTNLQHKRVKSGVYYVLASSGPTDDTNLGKVGKILVVN